MHLTKYEKGNIINCNQDDDKCSVTYIVDKKSLSVKLIAPYSDGRRKAVSERIKRPILSRKSQS